MRKMSLMVAILLLSMATYAQKGKAGKTLCKGEKTEYRQSQRDDAIWERIPNITEAQKVQIKDLRSKHHKEMQKMRLELDKHELALKELRLAEQMDTKAANAIIDQKAALRAKMQKERLQNHEAIKALLTPEQREAMPIHPMRPNAKRQPCKKGGRNNCKR